jgi:hypothetical protein
MSFRHETRAEIILDSINEFGVRLTTMEVTFHRFILAEVNTHRKLSRNSASSRAIPLETMLQRAIDHPALPILWPREQPGMSGGADLEGVDLWDAEDVLADIRNYTTSRLREYVENHPDKSTRLHKSLLNRPLEWFMWHTAIISSTEWDNLFHQRISTTAQPEFYELAVAMQDALHRSDPVERQANEMHLPYTSMEERATLTAEELIKISTARCARVSYLTHDGKRDISEDIRMFDETLWANGHWSPMEHPAMATATVSPLSNFDSGWVQVRQFVERNQWGTLLDHANRFEA